MSKATKSKTPPEDVVETFDCEQRSEEWFRLRMGIVTASSMHALMATSDEQKQRRGLLHYMAGELLTDTPIETYTNAAMERGRAMEQAALDHYAFVTQVDLTYVGFIKRTVATAFGSITVGCSPDALVGDEGIVEIKTMQPNLMVEFIDSKRLPTEHRWQCHAAMWVMGRAWCDCKLFYTGMPVSPVFRFERNEGLIRQMAEQVERFDYDLRKLVERIKGG